MTEKPTLFTGTKEEFSIYEAKLHKQAAASNKSLYGFKAQPINGPFLTPRELAAAFKVSTKTLERWRKHGGGPPFIKWQTGAIRYSVAALDKWVEEQLLASMKNVDASAPDAIPHD